MSVSRTDVRQKDRLQSGAIKLHYKEGKQLRHSLKFILLWSSDTLQQVSITYLTFKKLKKTLYAGKFQVMFHVLQFKN